jgi:hypothetical protein
LSLRFDKRLGIDIRRRFYKHSVGIPELVYKSLLRQVAITLTGSIRDVEVRGPGQ